MDAVRQHHPRAQEIEARQPLDRRHPVLLAHGGELVGRLAAVEAHRAAQLVGGIPCPPQQLGRAGLDPVRCEHAADQPAMPPVHLAHELPGLLEPGKAASLVEMAPGAARLVGVGEPGHVGGPEIGAQAQLARHVGDAGELVGTLGPGAVEEGGDRLGGGDPVQDQLHHGVVAAEILLVGRVDLARAALEIAPGPDAAVQVVRLVVEAEHGGIEVEERVEVDEAGPDHGLAEIEIQGQRSVVSTADEDDRGALEHDLAGLEQPVARPVEGHDPLRAKPHSAHDALPTAAACPASSAPDD